VTARTRPSDALRPWYVDPSAVDLFPAKSNALLGAARIVPISRCPGLTTAREALFKAARLMKTADALWGFVQA
jgi:hypothetical protein